MIKIIFSTLLSFILLGCNKEVQDSEVAFNKLEGTPKVKPFIPAKNQFKDVWDRVKSDQLNTLPQNTVSYSKLFDGAVDLILKDAKRTLVSHDDILPYFDKLAHPNGVCLKGVWEIDTANIYSGYFKNGSKALFIGRASTALSDTKRGETRAFGLGGKLFATMDELELLDMPSANFFVIDDLGGTDAEYYSDVELTNEPDVSFTSSVFSAFAYGLKVANTFSSVDTNSGIRQLYEISYLKEKNTSKIITPKWIKIKAQTGQTKDGVDDFRDEFVLDKNEVFIFDIFVASVELNGIKQFKKIGKITINESVVSSTCDHNLHFHHPKFRDDLLYR